MKNIFILLLGITALFSCKKKVMNDDNVLGPEIVPSGLLSSSPQFPTMNKPLTIIFDASKGNKELLNTQDVYIHTGVISTNSSEASDWKYFANQEFNKPHEPSKMRFLGDNKYSITINPTRFYNVPLGEKILKLAMVFRNADGSKVGRNTDGSDIYLSIHDENDLIVGFSNPLFDPLFEPKPILEILNIGQQLSVTGISSSEADLSLYLNGERFAESSNRSVINGSIVLKSNGIQKITVKGIQGNKNAEYSFNFVVGGEVETLELPSGVERNGVTLLHGGRSAIFTLYAPQKRYMHLIGDFNSWQVNNDYAMKRTPDEKVWWIQLDNLQPNTSYAYQFLVDGGLKIADPYCELILDPVNDKGIPFVTYPSLKVYPTGQTNGVVSVVNTAPDNYNWKDVNFKRPPKDQLVIYELHVRDFIKAANYDTLIDTLNYLENLGINAIELMPINEFEGNSSWGYNPSFYFAPDKYYGTKIALKRLIDECHVRGIAVILDLVLNHSFGQSPMVQLYFDNQSRKLTGSPWHNERAMHPYNVGFDFNHESEATKHFSKKVMEFWIKEYRIDGFRFDLSKGFTQTDYGTSEQDVDRWSRYDAGRIAIWKEYNNYIKSIASGDFYVILEHFAYDDEEKILEKEGIMFWNNMHHNFSEASMGYISNSDLSRAFHTNHGFTTPGNLITYMESHDEERMMFKNLKYGNSSSNYSIKDLETALKRQEMAAAFLFSIPGPKMMWQFGELGYDISINQNTRTGEKPILWNYQSHSQRNHLLRTFSKLIKMKINNEVFNTTLFTYNVDSAVKYVILKGSNNKVVVIGNFDVEPHTVQIPFPKDGVWTDFIGKNKLSIKGPHNKTLLPGEFYIYSEVPLL